jgi:hypothetical protein
LLLAVNLDEATVEVGQSHLIVDTGPWMFGKKVMLPAGVVDRVDLGAETIYINRSKDEIKSAPEYEPGSNSEPNYRRVASGGSGTTPRDGTHLQQRRIGPPHLCWGGALIAKAKVGQKFAFEHRRSKKKSPISRAFLVAGAGFEPATSGL